MNLKQFDHSKPVFTRGRTTDKNGESHYVSGGTAIRLILHNSRISGILPIKEDHPGGSRITAYRVDLPPEYAKPGSFIHESVAPDGQYPNYPIEFMRLHAPVHFSSSGNSFTLLRETCAAQQYRKHFALMPFVASELGEMSSAPVLEAGHGIHFAKPTPTISLLYNGKVTEHISLKGELRLGVFSFKNAGDMYRQLMETLVTQDLSSSKGMKMLPQLSEKNLYVVAHALHTACKTISVKRKETSFMSFAYDKAEFSIGFLNEINATITGSSAVMPEDEFFLPV